LEHSVAQQRVVGFSLEYRTVKLVSTAQKERIAEFSPLLFGFVCLCFFVDVQARKTHSSTLCVPHFPNLSMAKMMHKQALFVVAKHWL
jgi:hypothetical protein